MNASLKAMPRRSLNAYITMLPEFGISIRRDTPFEILRSFYPGAWKFALFGNMIVIILGFQIL